MINKILITLGLKEREYVSFSTFQEKARTKSMLERLNEIRKMRCE